jgi:N-acetylglutamate synthase-like GNAT family acetyltransferase
MNHESQIEKTVKPDISVRLLQENDLPIADRIFRVAFGTFIGVPEPERFFGDADYVKTRWKAHPEAFFAAEIDGEVVGSNFATNWGSVGFFGPLTIRPDVWDKGIGKRLMEPIMNLFDEWKTKHAGLFTFSHSAKHVGLYHKFGFCPRFLTAIMSKAVKSTKSEAQWTRFSTILPDEQTEALRNCRELTDAIYEGLNVENEIRAVANQNLGDTILLWDNSKLVGFAVCHTGAGTEAGSGTCYIKFAAARPGKNAELNFNRLLDICEEMAAAENLTRFAAGVNMGRIEAYRQMLRHGFRTDMQGVAMDKPNEAGYNRPDVYLIDDWR